MRDPRCFFDAFAKVGPRQKKHPAHPWSLDHLVREMDHCSISGALVSSTLSVFYEPMYGNLRLSREVEGNGRLVPVWNVLPTHSGEFPKVSELDELLKAHAVAAVSIHPKTNGWRWQAEYARELLEWLQEKEILVTVPRGEFSDFGELECFLESYSKLPLLLTGSGWMEQREIIPLVRRFRNLHLTLEKFQIHYGPEFFEREGCAEQVLFGSGGPAMSVGAARCFFDYADISTASATAMAGGNLRRLLKGRGPEKAVVNSEEDLLMSAARKGLPLPGGFIDMHMHILHEGMNGAGESHRMEGGGPKGVFSLLEKLGCEGGGFMSWLGPVSCDSLAGNDCVREALEVAPKGYWGLATFDPVHLSRTELEFRVPEVFDDPRFIGIKPYVRFGVEYHDSSYEPLWAYGNQHELYGLLHRVRGDFQEVGTLAERYPRMRWVVAHCGKDFRAADLTIEAIRRHTNIFAEITHTAVPTGIIEYLVEGAGEDRVLYGSDLPMRDPRPQLGWVVFSRLPIEVKIKILRENALQVIEPLKNRLPRKNFPRVK